MNGRGYYEYWLDSVYVYGKNKYHTQRNAINLGGQNGIDKNVNGRCIDFEIL
jgi:hypothetical protein